MFNHRSNGFKSHILETLNILHKHKNNDVYESEFIDVLSVFFTFFFLNSQDFLLFSHL